jgi:serine/threonine protein kinase
MEALKKANHPYVIQLREIIDTEKNLFVLQEFAEGGELFERLIEHGVLSELQAAKFVRKLLVALGYLHTQCNLIHRDLKVKERKKEKRERKKERKKEKRERGKERKEKEKKNLSGLHIFYNFFSFFLSLLA